MKMLTRAIENVCEMMILGFFFHIGWNFFDWAYAVIMRHGSFTFH